MNRRTFISLLDGGTILAAGGGAAAFAVTRMPEKALLPWAEAGSLYDEPRMRALSYAILAPNPHNRQPWIADLSTPDEVTLHADLDRLLPHTDPFHRQITIGLGCFLELMRMAAAQDGYRVETELFPDGFDDERLDQRPVAVARFFRDEAVRPDPLFAHVPQRRSLKEPYDMARPVLDGAPARIAGAAPGTFASNDEAHVEALRRLTHEALAIETETPHTYKESVDLFRIGRAEIEANPDGIDFSGPMFETLAMLGRFTCEAAFDRSSSTYEQGIAAVMEQADTAMAHVWTVTPSNTRLDQIAAGTSWLRINLAATGEGIGTQPMSQAL